MSRERFLRNLRAVEAVLSGTTVVDAAREHQIARSTLSRLVQRTRKHGVLACVPHGTYHRERDLHPAFQEVIRRLYQLPTKLSLTAIVEHADLVRAAKRVQQDTGSAPALPSYKQVRSYVRVLKQETQGSSRAREQVKGPLRDRQSPRSFVLSIPAPAQLVNACVNLRRDNFDHPCVLCFLPVANLQSSHSRLFCHTTDRCGPPPCGRSSPPGRSVVDGWRRDERTRDIPQSLPRSLVSSAKPTTGIQVVRSAAPAASTRSLLMPTEQGLSTPGHNGSRLPHA